MNHPTAPALDTDRMRDEIHAALGRIGEHLIRFGEQVRAMFGAISKSFASYLGIKPRLTRTELRIIRVLERSSRRTRRAERRQQRRTLAARRTEQRSTGRARRGRMHAARPARAAATVRS